MKPWLYIVLCAIPLIGAHRAYAFDDAGSNAPPAVQTHHHGVFHGVPVGYTAYVEKFHVGDGAKGPAADLVSFAYVADHVADPSARPVIFAFNGGPITASVYLQMLAFGPKRLAIPDDVKADPATFRLVDNPYCPLDYADVVFFDPASTGYSRVAPGTSPRAYFSVDADAQQFTQFVQAWLQAHGRTGSPVYLFGESYGTIRAAVAAKMLVHLPHPVNLQGVFLQGQALNIIEFSQRHDNIISYVVSLPTLAALGWYFDKVDHRGRSFEQFLDEVRRFARTDYLEALFQGRNLDSAERDRVAARLAAYTGLPAPIFVSNELKVSKVMYGTELFKDQHEILGTDDGRYLATPTTANEHPDGSDVFTVAAEKAFKNYAAAELGIPDKYTYVDQAMVKGLEDWDWGQHTPFSDWTYPSMLGDVFAHTPTFHVVLGVGYYDTTTSVGAVEYLLSQSNWPADRARIAYYQGGHMAYSVEASLRQMSDDLRGLITASHSAVAAKAVTP